MRLKTIISGLAAGCLLAMGSPIWAQNTNTTSTNQPPHLQALPGGPGAPGARPGGLQGILSEEQWASFQKINAETRDKVMELRPKISAAQREALEAGLSAKFDEALVQQKAQVVAQLYAEMLVAQAKAFSEIQPPLSAEQIEKIKDLQRPSVNPRMLHPAAPPPAATNQNGLPPKP
jgi:Spy/CpxP family protein refolding chaperone